MISTDASVAVAGAGLLMEREIGEQPAKLAELITQQGQLAEVAALIRARRPRAVLFAARGTSRNAASYAKRLIEVKLGLPVGFASPASLTGYGATPDYRDVVWIAVSQSGASPDLVQSTAAATAAGALTIAVTNNPSSALAQSAQLSVDVCAGPELAVAATKSYTNQLLALWLLTQHWMGAPTADASELPALSAEALAVADTRGWVDELRETSRLFIASRGYGEATAQEAALKLMETSYLSAHGWSSAEMMHGPLALAGPECPVILVDPPTRSAIGLGRVVDVLRERSTPVYMVRHADAAPSPTVDGVADARVIHLPNIRDDLAPIIQVMPFQRLALKLSLIRGMNPDAPRALKKETMTE